MNTAVGFDAATSAASFRAGISRAGSIDYEVFSEAENELVSAVGHGASVTALEAEGIGKMVALGVHALRDLAREPNWSKRRNERIGFYLTLPNLSLRQARVLDVNEALRSGVDPRTQVSDDDDEVDPMLALRFAEDCNEHLLPRMARAAGIELEVFHRRYSYGNQMHFLTLLAEAIEDLADGRVERCIVGGIDSFLDPLSLEWAMEQRRVKTEAEPCGFMPGEAAVFLEIAPEGADESGGVHIIAPQFGREPPQNEERGLPLGIGLASAIAKSLGDECGGVPGLVIGDLNGEIDRAQDWGCALSRLVGRFPALNQARHWIPAESFGETGCAMPGLAIGTGYEAIRRGYAQTDTLLIWCSSDSEMRGSVVVRNS